MERKVNIKKNITPGKLHRRSKLISFFVGPGSYQFRSDFDLNKYIKEMDERGTYLTIDNGHLNQKKQPFLKSKDRKG